MEASVCGRLVDPRGFLGEGCVNVEDGVIKSIGRSPSGDQVYSFYAENVFVTPGLIDLHVHLRGLDLSYKEDEESGTKAALSSGVTLVVDMPNTRPRLATPEALRLKLEALRERSYVDYGVYAGVPDSEALVDKLASMPIAGFKIYPEDMDLRASSVSRALSTGALVVLHPELPEAERVGWGENAERGEARGCWLEGASVHLLSTYGPLKRLHVTHVSCPGTLRVAKSYGATTDTTPHHVLYDYSHEGCHFKVNPPLRDPVTRSLMLRELINGGIDALASDHAPHSPREKDSWAYCPPGIPWLGLWPPLLLGLVRSGALKLTEFLRLTSLGPAGILGLDHLYGLLEVNYRANLVVIDLNGWGRFSGTYSKARYLHAFMEGLQATIRAVFVSGELAAEEGEVLLRPPVLNPFEGSELGRPER